MSAEKNEMDIDFIREFAFHMRKHALAMAFSAGSHASHFGAGFSLIDILAVLYAHVLRLDKGNPTWPERDRVILSKGHGVLAYYAALAEYGYIPKEDLPSFEQDGSYLFGHPVRSPKHGIEFTNGSLGMGLSLGIGTALALKKRGSGSRVFVIMGDGEMDEGSVWEAFMAGSQFHLDNLIAVIDRNRMQLGGDTEGIISQDLLAERIPSFGWDCYEAQGHDLEDLTHTVQLALKCGRPSAIIAHTVKGRGFSFSEGNNAWHHAVLTQKQYESALEELEASYHGN